MSVTKLHRETFQTSKELITQTGHQPRDWPLGLLKEPVDNALDACEEAGTPPEVSVTVEPGSIAVTDNGPGIHPETIAGVRDFAVRVSSQESYISPTGNALEDDRRHAVRPERRRQGRAGINHGQGCSSPNWPESGPIRQVPVIDYRSEPNIAIRKGTTIRVMWPECACQLLHDAKARFLQGAADYAFLNPHLTLFTTLERSVGSGGPPRLPRT